MQNRSLSLLLTSADQWQKSLATTGASSALLRLETHYASTPGIRRGLEGPGGAEGAVMGSLAKCYCTSRLSERSLNSALSCGWPGSSRQGWAELRELLARPDADGGEVPDIVVGSHIGPFSSGGVSALLRRGSLYPGLTGNRVSTWGDI
jgi:hypothetical protein